MDGRGAGGGMGWWEGVGNGNFSSPQHLVVCLAGWLVGLTGVGGEIGGEGMCVRKSNFNQLVGCLVCRVGRVGQQGRDEGAHCGVGAVREGAGREWLQ